MVVAAFSTLLRQCKTLLQATTLHQQLLCHGLFPQFTINLTSTYVALNAPLHALSILRSLLPSPSAVYWWNNLIRRALHIGFLNGALDLFSSMRRLSWKPDHYTFPFVLKACGEIPSFRHGASVHGVIYVTGFESNVFVCNALVAMYGRCGGIDNAMKMFDEMLERGVNDVVSWNSIVAVNVQSGDFRRAFKLFGGMTNDVSVQPDEVSLVNVLSACCAARDCSKGKQIHGYAFRNELFEDVYVGNAVVDMYAKCGMMDQAGKVFEKMKEKDVVSWNAMVTGYSQNGRFEDALGLFEKMRQDKVELNVITWSAVIAGYAQRGQGHEAIDVFRLMQLSKSKANVVTFVSLLSGCAAIGALIQGKEAHCYALKCILDFDGSDPGDDIMVINALIDMYAKCKSFVLGRAMFDLVVPNDRTVVTWTVMIGGYAQHGEANDALELFSQMLKQDISVKPNVFTISCVLMACARLGALRFGKQIHGYVLRNQYHSMMLFVSNCLIDMYSKSGDIDAARFVFDNMQQQNAVSWTSLMNGYAMHGRWKETVWVFDEMGKVGLVPDSVTFLVLLYACSHSGMVAEGIEYFNSMQNGFGVNPGEEHYACMVDLLGRAGRFEEAMKLIEDMPMEPTTLVWVALLSGCRIHGKVELGEYAAKQLAALDSENDGSYTLLSNIYASAMRWKDVARIRSQMKHTGIRKRPGCSWVQGKEGTSSFFVGDRTHPQSQQIYNTLTDLIHRIKLLGYVPETSFALHDVDDEEKGDLLFEHSEKLALAFGILTSTPGMPIRITKNLRVCGDCHSAFTYISTIIDHEIILRDPSRFHHFKNGSCSCKGYW